MKSMNWTDVPEEWLDRCSGDGYERYTDEAGVKRYMDNNEPVDSGYRPCARCGEYPINEGEDHCLGHLGTVMNACCGHGNKKGYIQFDNGVIIRGYFEIEYFDV